MTDTLTPPPQQPSAPAPSAPPSRTRASSTVIAILTIAFGVVVIVGALVATSFRAVGAATVDDASHTADAVGVRTLDVDVVQVTDDGAPVTSDDPELLLPHPGTPDRATVLGPVRVMPRELEDVTAAARKVMESAAAPAVQIDVPLVVDAGHGKNWAEAH